MFFLDYFATGKLDPEVFTQVIEGLTTACREAGCALLGGETAEMPGVYALGDYDLAGFVVGMVEPGLIRDPKEIRIGDVLIGLPSSGLHTNGFSLLRKVFEGVPLSQVYEELGREPDDTLVIQFDAHLDIYDLSDCTTELSHGNFLLHAKGLLPKIINVGSRELLLQPEYVARFYERVFPAAEIAVAADRVVRDLRAAGETAKRIFLDIDCDVFDPGSFAAVANPVPFGVSAETLLRLLEAAWSRGSSAGSSPG